MNDIWSKSAAKIQWYQTFPPRFRGSLILRFHPPQRTAHMWDKIFACGTPFFAVSYRCRYILFNWCYSDIIGKFRAIFVDRKISLIWTKLLINHFTIFSSRLTNLNWSQFKRFYTFWQEVFLSVHLFLRSDPPTFLSARFRNPQRYPATVTRTHFCSSTWNIPYCRWRFHRSLPVVGHYWPVRLPPGAICTSRIC